MIMRLVRTTPLDRPYTMGYFELPDGRHIYSLERPWIACAPIPLHPVIEQRTPSPFSPPCGRKGVSCVPGGSYRLERHNSEDHPGTLALVNHDLWVYHHESDVPPSQLGFARTDVLIHPANFPSQLRGCIAPGLIMGNGYVENSRAATELLYKTLTHGDTLEIVYE